MELAGRQQNGIGKEFDDVMTVELFNKTISAHKGALQEVIIQLGM